jgi:hypothetical protein
MGGAARILLASRGLAELGLGAPAAAAPGARVLGTACAEWMRESFAPMKPSLLAASSLLLAMASPASAVTIDLFEVNQLGDPFRYRAWVSWDPGIAQPEVASAEVIDDPPEVIVGGIAFLTVTATGSGLMVVTAPTDTNGDYSPEAVDHFALAVGGDEPLPGAFEGVVIPSHFFPGYTVGRHPQTRFGLQLSVGRHPPVDVPDGGSTLAGLALAAVGCRVLQLLGRTRGSPAASPRCPAPRA